MINHDSDVPVYAQLAGILRDMITSGQVRPHERLPSISYLVQTYGVADQTVKKAMQVLRDEGLVQTVTGKGVYVVERPLVLADHASQSSPAAPAATCCA